MNRRCIPAFSTRGKGAFGPLLSAPAGASERETRTSNLTESTESYSWMDRKQHFSEGGKEERSTICLLCSEPKTLS